MATNRNGHGVSQGATLAFGAAMLGLALALAGAVTMLQRERAGALAQAARADSLARVLGERAPATAPAATLSAEDAGRLRRAGLHDPEAELRADLVKHPELIPFGSPDEPAMFFVPASVRVLNDRWAIADAENGHNGGRVLLEFAVDHGRIRWKRLAAEEY